MPGQGASFRAAAPRAVAPAGKQELARYYESVAEWLLPHLHDRPLTLLRCPQGSGEECFFQRHPQGSMPRRGKFVVADTLPELLQLVRLGVVELHTWGARAGKPLLPDRVTFDLDPDADLPWRKLVEGALLLRTLLSDLGLESYVKTTGGKGLHVVVPLQPESSWNAVRAFARSVASRLAATLPGQFTASPAKTQRKGRIFVDWLRNQQGSTAVAAYSVRARKGGTVSVPLAWGELTMKLKPERFNLRTVPARLKALGDDPWEGYAEEQRLARALQRMS